MILVKKYDIGSMPIIEKAEPVNFVIIVNHKILW